ncbi:MAG: tetraacyldisaccharide 4'-kinase [Candidatus Gastranaerophilales bacterium]|nr:tetraacyldisaccharide 4'-kinase [Candidatus Gastranaerophilales bacterium]
MKNFIHKIHYSKNLSIIQYLLRLPLWFVSLFYAVGVWIRNFLYDLGLLHTEKLSQTVISIGNLTTGGTGKTPVTAEIAKIAAKSGKKVVILSRGYGGSLPLDEVSLISDGEQVFYDAKQAGDEPFWHAQNVKGVAVVTCKDRVKAAKWAVENLGAELFILDDGFQYRKLFRDLNIVLVDGHKKFGNEMLLPAGPLREPLSQIKRADKVIVVNKIPYDKQTVRDCRAYSIYLIKQFDKEVFGCNILATGIHRIGSKAPVMSMKNVYAFTGVAQPEFFFESLRAHQHNLVKKLEFDDHYAYQKQDLVDIIEDAKKSGADIIVTTEKDFVKLSAYIDEVSLDIPLYTARQAVELDIAGLLKGTVEY